LSANHSCKPAGVERNSYKITGEHLTGNSIEKSCLAIVVGLIFEHFSCLYSLQ